MRNNKINEFDFFIVSYLLHICWLSTHWWTLYDSTWREMKPVFQLKYIFCLRLSFLFDVICYDRCNSLIQSYLWNERYADVIRPPWGDKNMKLRWNFKRCLCFLRAFAKINAFISASNFYILLRNMVDSTLHLFLFNR